MQVAPIWMLVVIAALVPLNLMLEAMKFRLLLPRESRPSRFQALRRVCAGLSVGLFTPNRVGEYLGRLAGTDARHRAATKIS